MWHSPISQCTYIINIFNDVKNAVVYLKRNNQSYFNLTLNIKENNDHVLDIVKISKI